jgi:hypothetical protein
MMRSIRKRPYTEVKGLFRDKGDPFSAHGEWEAEDLQQGRSVCTKALPQGGPADLELLLQLPEACLSKDVRIAVQKAAAAGSNTASPECAFLGVRRKQRCCSLANPM